MRLLAEFSVALDSTARTLATLYAAASDKWLNPDFPTIDGALAVADSASISIAGGDARRGFQITPTSSVGQIIADKTLVSITENSLVQSVKHVTGSSSPVIAVAIYG